MAKKLYSVYDKKADVYSPIMQFDNDVSAVRNFQQACAQNDSLLSRYPDDFRLDYVGDFDSKLGILYPINAPKVIVEASSLVESVK